jgi:hypothetical protein
MLAKAFDHQLYMANYQRITSSPLGPPLTCKNIEFYRIIILPKNMQLEHGIPPRILPIFKEKSIKHYSLIKLTSSLKTKRYDVFL